MNIASNTRFKACFVLGVSLLVIGVSNQAWAYQIRIDELVEAIGKAENSVRYPYGVKSINTHGDKALARRICRNSVVNNIRRWERAGSKGDFISFMGARYAPINGKATDDPMGLNSNWVRNVTYYYNKGGA